MSSDLLEKLLLIPETGNNRADLKRSISRNIKVLLESRRFIGHVKDVYPESGSSLYEHGLADWSMSRNIYQGNRICRDIVELLEKFEPRLHSVVVERAQAQHRDNCLYFRIEGSLVGENDEESTPVVFDTSISLTSFHFEIEESKLA
ncbi:type VI secretion system baseplate subunit TssE [Endozoicomonas sp. OPT23]|uniref:type VI secretion system baseplate subunit TssE n=1 Tax=Endozoicomonas sp. OPT23 TaxID=2072845 RepID=UPI00129A373F|nr:type VI secretion system baseplate subunit TssE [Endozoicomonas sp. OPT23]MRI33745.1 type VI secretion system baseplate subunit TssE [Endozoicomonas sp. OPT23]